METSMRAIRALIPALALLAACSGPAPASRAQQNVDLPAPRQVPPDLATMKMSFAPVVHRAAPAVVNVFSKRVVRQQLDPFWGMFAGGMTREAVQQSLGSGSISTMSTPG